MSLGLFGTSLVNVGGSLAVGGDPKTSSECWLCM